MTLLRQLAQAHRIGLEYTAFDGQTREVSDASLRAILTAMDVDVSDEQAQAAALKAVEEAPWRRTLPHCVVTHDGQEKYLPVHVPHGSEVFVQLIHQSTGERKSLAQADHWVDPREIDGQLIGQATFVIPAGLALGWYEVVATTLDGTVRTPLAVTPQHARRDLSDPVSEAKAHRWGAQLQLYACTSAQSWGLGDFADLATLAEQLAADSADFVLINPVHAANYFPQVTASPYSPTSRRFVDALYLRPQRCPEYGQLPDEVKASIDTLAEQARRLNDAELIDRDAVWQLKRRALQLLFQEGMSPSRRWQLDEFLTEQGEALVEFAAWSVNQARHHGVTADSDDRLLLEPDFHAWLQLSCREQLAQAQRSALMAGMQVGIVHDLAVGVDQRSADADLLEHSLVKGVHVGAPPDMFNQLGQDWGQPPWHPEELVAAGYKPFWDVIRSAIVDAGGLRIDHILGLFRLWWIPEGQPPSEGAYVHYDHEALIGLCLLAAAESDAVLIGEDLGTFEPWVAGYLGSRGLLGTTIYFFEQDVGQPRDTAGYRAGALASITTHDLPPAAGYLTAEHVSLRNRLGLLTTEPGVELDGLAAQISGLVGHLQGIGALAPDYEFDATDTASVEALVVACHQDLLRAPSRMLGVSLVDMVGQRVVQNQPGTSWQYPNWCVPLADGSGRRIPIEQLRDQPTYQRLVEVFAAAQ